MDRRLAIIGIAIATLLAGVIRVSRLDVESLWIDELTQVATYDLPVSYIVGAAANTTQPPLDYWIGAGLDRLGLAKSDWWVRFPAAMFGIGGVALTGWWVWRLAGAVAGIAAACLLAICPLHVSMSQEARPYTIFVFLTLGVVALFELAWRKHRARWWCLFGVAFLCFLLSRWIEPHIVTVGILVWSLWECLCSRTARRAESVAPQTIADRVDQGSQGVKRSSTIRFWAACTTIVTCYAIYNPVFGIVFDRNRRAVDAQSVEWLARFWTNLTDAATSVVCGYSSRTLKPVDAPHWIVMLAAFVTVSGLIILIWQQFRRREGVGSSLFFLTIVAFPIVFGLVFARFTATPAKPQYLLLLVVPMIAGVAVCADGLRRMVLPAGSRAAWCSFAAVYAVAAIPMLCGTWRCIRDVEKCDWRAAMTYLQEHARAGDGFASVGSDTLPTTYHALTPKIKRYFKSDSRFYWVDADADLAPLTQAPWFQVGGTVWVLGYNDRMYTGYDLLPTPPSAANITVHAFNGLFLLEIHGNEPAVERLMDGLAYLGRNLPEKSSLTGPHILRSRYYRQRGEIATSEAALEEARRQCGNGNEARVLEQRYAEGIGQTLHGTR